MKKLFILSILFLVSTGTALHAQKLPTEQQVSLRAPADMKIDGKATEWGNEFQAYNKHTDFYYTIANDDDNLYLVIQATDPDIIRHIIGGGITLAVNKAGKKDDKIAPAITYPVFEKNSRFTPILKNPRMTAVLGANKGKMDPDSIMAANNKSFNDKAKLIKTRNISNVDTLISVYNTDGIKAAGSFDTKPAFTCELSISLKSLGLSIDNPLKFAYHLTLNEVELQGATITNGANGIKMVNITGAGAPVIGQDATDFWGEYTLAKK